MNKTIRFQSYGLENLKEKDLDFFDDVSIESIISTIEETCKDYVSMEGISDAVSSIKDMIVKAINSIWEFIKKVGGAIKDFFTNIFKRDKKLDEDLSATQEKIKQLKHIKTENSVSKESISLEDDSQSINIGAVAAIDIHNREGEEVTIKEFDSLIGEFNKTMNSMNGYFQQVDTHLKTVSDLKEDVIASGNADRVVSQIKNKPSIPSSMRAKEFDFFTVGKIGLPDHFVEPDSKGLPALAESFNKNVPRLIKNVSVADISLKLNNIADVVSLADKWHGDLEHVRSAGKLSGQYLKMTLSLLEEKEKHFSNIANKIEDIMKKEGNSKEAVANFQAYASGVRAQINYINMYIHVMTYYHNAFAKIASSIKKVLDKLLDMYLNSF